MWNSRRKQTTQNVVKQASLQRNVSACSLLYTKEYCLLFQSILERSITGK